MTGEMIADRMRRTPLYAVPLEAALVKVTFLLNLIAGQNFTENQVLNARDALMSMMQRKMISDLLLLASPRSGRYDAVDPPLAGHNETTLPLMESGDDERLLRRLVAFLRPDPKMTVEVERKEIDTEPRLVVFQVNIEDGRGGSWCESFATEDALRAFLRGIRVTYAMSDLQRMLPDFGDDKPFAFVEQSVVQTL